MKKATLSIILFIGYIVFLSAQSVPKKEKFGMEATRLYQDSRPWTRWWWFASVIEKKAIIDNLQWLKKNGFGGVEIAWVYPLNRMQKDTIHYTPRQEWLSPQWMEMVKFTKQCTDSMNLGCDFTFGSLWPFGDIKVPYSEATRNLKDTLWRQDIRASWDYPKKGYVIDHLNRKAFFNYAARTGDALKPALTGLVSGLFCDSWEVETKYLTTPGFDVNFKKEYGYSITDYSDSLYSNSDPYKQVRYDYMKLLSSYVIEEFYKPFTQKSHELGAYSRVQCSGAPCDIISSYATVDVPESEALLYEPSYSNIVASAAGLSGKKVVTSETFTCLYGWPRNHHSEEQTADLKLLADALFANGVNHIIWHGKPFNPAGNDSVKFYASVHVGESGSLAEEIQAFNHYMEQVSTAMKEGVTYSDIAVYLPTEDSWIAGELPIEKQMIWAWGAYEQRNTYLPEELKAWRPLWINSEFLKKANYKNGRLYAGDLSFSSLYLDVKYLDIEVLKHMVELAGQGLSICLKQNPEEPGLHKSKANYKMLIEKLRKFSNVKQRWNEMKKINPIITGTEKFDYWCRTTNDGLIVFFANPKSKHLTFPLEFGQSLNDKKEIFPIEIQYHGNKIPVVLAFNPYQSLLIKIDKNHKVSFIDISFIPKTPKYEPRVKKDRELWEVEKLKK
jgi:hypothetical protein